jgi:tRNA threonylcarbamoyladenosine biosynthesis protein TsaB
MITLFIDTADKDLTVGVYKDDNILKLNSYSNDITLSSRLVPIIKSTIEDVNVDKKDIDKIIVVDGPGSFTGTRMGVVVAKTYAWTLNKIIIPVSKLELMATTNVDSKYVLSVIDARHDYVYAGLYDDNLNNVIEDKHIHIEELKSILDKYNDVTIVSDDSFEFKTVKTTTNIDKIIFKYKDDKGLNPHKVNPNYLKRTEAEEKLGNKND